MHISEGILTPLILSGAAILSTAGVAAGLKRIASENLVTVALLSAAFFVASLIHVPIGPSSAHLILNGLLGVLLGWAAFPAICIGLFLQALLFQFGGFTTLGVNTLNMALPPVLCWYIFRPVIFASSDRKPHGTKQKHIALAAFACGFAAVALSAVMTAATLALSGNAFIPAAKVMLAASLPVMLIEGGITATVVGFLIKVRPEIFTAASLRIQQPSKTNAV